MAEAVETFEVPEEIVGDMEIAIEVLRTRLSQNLGKNVEIDLIEAETQGFGGAELGTALLSIPVAGLAIISKKWVEDVLWPEIKPKLKAPTQKMLSFLFELSGAKPGEP